VEVPPIEVEAGQYSMEVKHWEGEVKDPRRVQR
jgi:hypothetical protein